ncbi:hypothetical protein COX95_01145 [bacterium CG_4_10_14_0_2_um_filter_33_32]|nr:MAG: hypothetical protein AUJ93_04005 [bacterium CG2_30_33_46]PIR67580.1 MAG: hypothetical protein COU50_02545 [bacterium CG10_big_fil_rev_8_21_14_0_10_33_18]PIU76454.1 MAG: hypothetical protein COS74_03955 [bacterium CG06_land_8_20_14_3_00_33_50]PIW81150.1 MAG: hypothetical protein COZ97_03305 [bacterium CG_4_8_14_3_um_filter_33_28]PIY84892.1 MAG: hypothetical protein COY76_04795 [bacterium CG_4_10_14_0_8_um_filter_33_57]PIZ86507.1 MAG: hypothetical protein COX95_01145 [bacterium CG_4_10_1
MSNSICVQCIEIFKTLETPEKESIIFLFKEKKYFKHELIFTPYEGFENIYMIYKGKVEIYQVSAEGKKVIIDVLEGGEMFSNFSLAYSEEVKVTDFAEAKKDSEIYIMSKEDFLDLISKYPKLSLSIIQKLSKALNEADSRIRDLALNNVTTRAINELLRFSKKHGIKIAEGTEINTRLTHEEFAEIIGTSRETATKVLNKLRQLSFINLSKDKHIIVNTEKIQEQI